MNEWWVDGTDPHSPALEETRQKKAKLEEAGNKVEEALRKAFDDVSGLSYQSSTTTFFVHPKQAQQMKDLYSENK